MGVTIFNDIRMLKQFIYAFRLPIIWICSLGLESCHLDHLYWKRPLIHNELAVFFLFFPRNPVFLGCFRGKMGEKIRVLVNLFLQIKFDSFTILNR